MTNFTLTPKTPDTNKPVWAFLNGKTPIVLIYASYDMKEPEPKWRLPDYTSLEAEYGDEVEVTHWQYVEFPEEVSTMKVQNIEIIAPKRGEVSGCIITFITKDNIVKDSKLEVKHNDSVHYFDVFSVTLSTNRGLLIKANEVGYWARRLDRKQDFDIRELMNADITLITDPDKIASINQETCWC